MARQRRAYVQQQQDGSHCSCRHRLASALIGAFWGQRGTRHEQVQNLVVVVHKQHAATQVAGRSCRVKAASASMWKRSRKGREQAALMTVHVPWAEQQQLLHQGWEQYQRQQDVGVDELRPLPQGLVVALGGHLRGSSRTPHEPSCQGRCEGSLGAGMKGHILCGLGSCVCKHSPCTTSVLDHVAWRQTCNCMHDCSAMLSATTWALLGWQAACQFRKRSSCSVPCTRHAC